MLMRFLPAVAIAAALLSARVLPAQPSTVILVRHAERGTAPANDPALTDAGSARALALKEALAGAGVTAVVTTHLQRTVLTAKPLADAFGIAPVVVRVGAPLQAHLDSVAATVRRQPAGSVVLVVGHSNTIPGIVAALGGPRLPDLCDAQYASLFVLTWPAGTGAPRVIRATYGAADPPESADCARTMRP